MARSEEREFELVLGNKQILSLFFLVVVLFAVFFSLGFMVGKSAGPGQALAAAEPAAAVPAAANDRPSQVAPVLEAPASRGDAAPSGLPLDYALPDPAPGTAPVTETWPARTEAVAAPVPPAAAGTPSAESQAALAVRGLHLQVAALRVREDAQALSGTLRNKGYEVLLNEQARDGWYRVLIGPFPDERAAREMRDRLEKDGYKSILRRP
jgi:cell division septation protein DedD